MNNNILVIPDVHGRTFWKEAVKGREDNLIVFLGDYLDPYSHEGISQEDAFNNFLEILEFKKEHKDNVILLLGNHDCTYAIGTHICDCRANYARMKELSKLFNDNRELFQLAYETYVSDKRFIFSHAGIHRKYAERCFGENVDMDNIAEMFNDGWRQDTFGILDSLLAVSRYRGGWNNDNEASLVWADIREYASTPEDDFAYQIVGHTQLEKPVILDNIACLDCHRAFLLIGGKLCELDGKPIK